MPDESLIERAKAFAINAHEAVNHTRKYTGEPYAVHLQAVADLVTEVGGTAEMVAAAWLHDTVEDTSATLADIESEFGSPVAVLVDELTDISAPTVGNRTKRKALDRERLAKASPEAKTIKLADLIDNARSITVHDPRFARVFMGEKQMLIDVLRDGDNKLLLTAESMLNEYVDHQK